MNYTFANFAGLEVLFGFFRTLIAALMPIRLHTAPISGTGTVWNLPNYAGELMTPDFEVYPLLAMMGGLNPGVGRISTNFEFPLNAFYEHEAAAQPSITETASLTAPTATEAVKDQQKNVCQIHHESVDVSYAKQAGSGRLSGINTAGSSVSGPSELDFQIGFNLQAIQRQIEYSILLGSYQIATGAGVANKTRGINEAASDAGNTVDAGTATISKALIDSLLRTMDDNGADFIRPVIACNLFQKQKISAEYGIAPRDRNIGGFNITTIETDVGPVGLQHIKAGFQTASIVTIVDMAKLMPVFMEVPDEENGGSKGIMFYEELSKTGASSKGQLFGFFGLDYSADWHHGTITNLATS